MIDKGFIELEFVKSEDNTADIFTKNLGSELFSLHSEKLISNGREMINNIKGRVSDISI